MAIMRLFEILNIFSAQNRSLSSKEINNAVEHVIDSIDVKLRLVPSYKQKLRLAVSKALQYIDRLVDQVPGPYNFSRRSYINDPSVRAYFASPDAMQDVFSRSEELQAFFADPVNRDVDTCYSLLCSNKEEKAVIGSDLIGDRVRRDILQTTINFFDYKVLSPAVSSYDVRKGIKQCIFDGLITHALQHIATIKLVRRDLLDQQRIMHAQLRVRQAQGNGLSSMLAQGYADIWQSEALKKQYQEAGEKLEKMLGKHDVLSFYLDEVMRILSKPDDFIQLNVACFRLSDMRIKLDENTSQEANAVCFSELEIASVMKRVVSIASYSRDEMKLSH